MLQGIHVTALREIKILRELHSPHVVDLVEVFISSERNLALVLEYMESDLEAVIKDTSLILSRADVKAYMQMALQGLAACHTHNVMHRDIKPNNLLISPTGDRQNCLRLRMPARCGCATRHVQPCWNPCMQRPVLRCSKRLALAQPLHSHVLLACAHAHLFCLAQPVHIPLHHKEQYPHADIAPSAPTLPPSPLHATSTVPARPWRRVDKLHKHVQAS